MNLILLFKKFLQVKPLLKIYLNLLIKKALILNLIIRRQIRKFKRLLKHKLQNLIFLIFYQAIKKICLIFKILKKSPQAINKKTDLKLKYLSKKNFKDKKVLITWKLTIICKLNLLKNLHNKINIIKILIYNCTTS